jgi:hypothetical protein
MAPGLTGLGGEVVLVPMLVLLFGVGGTRTASVQVWLTTQNGVFLSERIQGSRTRRGRTHQRVRRVSPSRIAVRSFRKVALSFSGVVSTALQKPRPFQSAASG